MAGSAPPSRSTADLSTPTVAAGHACPRSDVSAWVGLVGLAGLGLWVLFCREWPAIVTALGLDLPALPLSGPFAAVLALAASGGPMVAWSLLVDKVHRDPASGIDWHHPRSWREAWTTARVKLAGLWATWALIGFGYCVARWYWQGPYLFAIGLIGAAMVPMALLSAPYVLWLDRVLVEPRDGAWHFGALLLGQGGHDREQVKRHLRVWAVKGFFTAFMLSILPGGFAQVVRWDWRAALADPAQLSGGLTNLLFMIDVQIGTVGYLLTLRPLAAQIRSANPYLAGWVAALICYPPFVQMGAGGAFDYHPYTADWNWWLAGHRALLWAWGLWLVLLTAIYAWATVAFGIRFSNLTHRGVLTNGPYRFTRHPAYLSKNLYWWSATLPFLATNHSLAEALRNTTLLALVSAIYWWRAKTEEAHLLAEDAKYRAYSAWIESRGLFSWARRTPPNPAPSRLASGIPPA